MNILEMNDYKAMFHINTLEVDEMVKEHFKRKLNVSDEDIKVKNEYGEDWYIYVKIDIVAKIEEAERLKEDIQNNMIRVYDKSTITENDYPEILRYYGVEYKKEREDNGTDNNE